VGLLLLFVLLVSLGLLPAIRDDWRRAKQRKLHAALNDQASRVSVFVEKHFLVQPCARCHESISVVTEASPNGRSVHCKCAVCGKDYWAPATTSEAAGVTRLYAEWRAALQRYVALVAARTRGNANVTVPVIQCRAPAAPLPFEKTTREIIPEGIRAEIWRRDNGRCVICGGAENLEYDHIIPVAKGGATAARNLQLLCRSCNRTKATSI